MLCNAPRWRGCPSDSGYRRVGSRCGLRRAVGWAMALASVALVGITPAETPAQTPAPPAYELQPGDEIRLIVLREPELSGLYLLDADGQIELPLAGEVGLGGLSIDQAEERIAGAWRGDYLVNPRVELEVTNLRPVYVMGGIRQPGPVPFDEGLTAADVIAAGGGISVEGADTRIRINRAESQGGGSRDASPATRLLPGDVIIVEVF